ncbi:MAG: hypothetical protein PUB96_03590 [Helicobacteraceae bacterium]|nr:hypothetical protein [Helicobacteraceae bacterium]
MTTHVFIVDSNTFKFHLEYQFVGTGAGNKIIDSNNSSTTKLHYATENNMLGLIADFCRVQIGDKVIFYLQQHDGEEGKFYGIFKIKSLVFLDNENYLEREGLGKNLILRCLIEPYEVYEKGVSEWAALDEIKNIQSPNQMLWSLIYRKLKGNRGNTMITIYESERLCALIRDKNNKQELKANYFTFDNEKIIISNEYKNYVGEFENINILPRLIDKFNKGLQFETHLQAYILQQIYKTNLFGCLESAEIEWLGNEVSCGVGMQRIDIAISLNAKNRKIIPIELKSTECYADILKQLQRYIDWLEQYYIPNRQSDIQPMIICRSCDKKSKNYNDLQIYKHNFDKSPFYINADDIKQCVRYFDKTSQKEVRVLCKQDSREERPQVFIDNNLFILPIKNGEYIICKGEGYVDILEIQTQAIEYKNKLDFELKSFYVGDSEMQHLDFAYASSLIRTFMEDSSLVLSIRGRKYTPPFCFNTQYYKDINTKSVQTEVDSGFEGRDKIVLVEAKNNLTTNIIIRQLYYPLRQWYINTQKEVSTLFFEKRDDLFLIWEFIFLDINNYNSITLKRSAKFKII